MVKLSLREAVEVQRLVRRRGFQIFWRIDWQMVLRFPPLPPGRFAVLISIRSRVGPRAVECLEELGQLENPST
jgi:hypothetical protein